MRCTELTLMATVLAIAPAVQWVVSPGGSFKVSATTPEGEIMAVRHRQFATHGVQFHPESILTPDGAALLRNFVELCRKPVRI